MLEENKAIGCIVGAAVGDALGMPTEEISREDLKRYFGGRVTKYEKALENHPNHFLAPGSWTDDTQQMLELADSLWLSDGFDMHDWTKRLVSWYDKCRTLTWTEGGKEMKYDRWAGGSSISSCRKLKQGIDPHSSGSTHSASTGSAMRIPPVGIFYAGNIDDVVRYAHLVSTPTHNTQVTKDAAALVAASVANLYRGMEPGDAVRDSIARISDAGLVEASNLAMQMAGKPEEEVHAMIGSGNLAAQAIPYGIYCFLTSPEDFEQAVIRAANSVPGDTDTVGVVAGALSGAYNGHDAIPDRFRAVETYKDLVQIGRNLANRKDYEKVEFDIDSLMAKKPVGEVLQVIGQNHPVNDDFGKVGAYCTYLGKKAELVLLSEGAVSKGGLRRNDLEIADYGLGDAYVQVRALRENPPAKKYFGVWVEKKPGANGAAEKIKAMRDSL